MSKGLTLLLLGSIFVMSGSAHAQRPLIDPDGTVVKSFIYTAPEMYQTWWKEIADCEGQTLSGDEQRVQWRVVASKYFRVVGGNYEDGTYAEAETFTPAFVIYVNQTGLVNRLLIEHEMEHVLLWEKYGAKYSGQHPGPYYSRCGLVPKSQQAIQDK